MRLRIYFLSLILFWSCGPEPIPEPQATILIAPADLNECTTSTVLSETESQVIQFTCIGMPGMEWQLCALFTHRNHFIHLRKIELGVNTLAVEVHGHGHDVHITSSLTVPQ